MDLYGDDYVFCCQVDRYVSVSQVFRKGYFGQLPCSAGKNHCHAAVIAETGKAERTGMYPFFGLF